MKRILVLTLILAALIGGFLWHRGKPEQQVARAVDLFLSNVEHRKISTRRQEDVHEALNSVLAPKVTFQGSWPIPTEEMTPEEVIAKVDQLHLLSTRFEMSKVERTIQIEGTRAQVHQKTAVQGAAGIGKHQLKREETWDLIIDLEKGEDWRITGVRGSQP